MNDDSQNKAYFEYLKTRSRITKLYRKWYLYPKLKRYFFDTVLDVGCGIGDFLGAYPDTVGIDINPYAVAHCNHSGHEAYITNGEMFPFNDETFSGLIMDNVLEHISHPEKLFNECRRVLTQRGIMIIGVPGKKGYHVDPTHKVFYSADDLKKSVFQFGFMHIHTMHVPIQSSLLSQLIKQYCIYGVFRKE